MYLLDTNVISEIRKGRRCDPGVAEWFFQADEDDLYLSVLVLGEIRRGIEMARRRRDFQQADRLEDWLGEVLSRFPDRISLVDSEVADAWGRLSAVRPLPVIDGLLAATAKAYGLTLVTRNISDVQGLDLELLNPFGN